MRPLALVLLAACQAGPKPDPDDSSPATTDSATTPTDTGPEETGAPDDTGATDPVTTIENGTYLPQPLAILPLGDSITQGCYRYDLWTRLVDGGYHFDLVGSQTAEPLLDGVTHDWPPYGGLEMDADHEGHSGWTSGEILTTPGSWDADKGTLYEWLDDYTPDVALIHLGTNDAFYEYRADTLTGNLATIIDTLRDDNPRVHVHLAQIIPLEYPYWRGGTYDRFVQGYNEAIATFAAGYTTDDSPILVVDQYTGFDGVADTYDLIHPNASGDVKVATRWLESLAADAAPVAVPDRYAADTTTLEVPRDTGLLANDRSLVGALRAQIVDPPAHGSLTLYSDGAFTYVGDGTADAFTYMASDGTAASAPTTVDLCGGPGCVTPPPDGFFVDCEHGDDTRDGRTPETAWGSLARLAAEPLGPGAAVWFVADTQCEGTLTLDGSGTSTAPITVGAWGDGPAPEIEGLDEAAIRLVDQSWITLDGLDVHGSSRWGVYVGATSLVEGITLTGLEVHDVRGGVADAKATGLVVFTVESTSGWFEDVLVEEVYAHDTDQWSGIFLYGTEWRQDGPRSTGITFRNNVVHDVGGDGIVVFGAADALLDANLAYEVGKTPTDAVGTPNGIWTWDCHQCTVQFNEAYHVHSPGVDGGAFDIDYDTVDNVVQYNYGHDNDGYCVAVFAAEGSVTSGAVVRYNVCVDNSQADDLSFQGDIYVSSWNRGSFGDVQIYNNTVVRRDDGYPPLVVYSELGAGSGIWNNVFLVDGDWMATVAGDPAMSNNLWWQPDPADHAWFDDDGLGWYDGLAAWEAAGRESDSLNVDPLLAGGAGKDEAMLGAGSPAIGAGRGVSGSESCDGFGNRWTGTPDVGAHAFAGTADPGCGP